MKILPIAFLAFGAFALAGAAHAQLSVIGNSEAAQCYRHALNGNTGSNSALKICAAAFDTRLTRRDQAATYVNRGILYMRKDEYMKAARDYEAALAINPDLTEAHVNYAASLIRQEKYDAAFLSIEKALTDPKSEIRPEALFNRAVILDYRENYRGAYRDLKAALAIRPDWAPAIQRLERYEVRPAG